MCECPFCTITSVGDELPIPVRIPIYPFSHFATCGWMTSNDGDGNIGISIVYGGRMLTYFDHHEMVRYLGLLFPTESQHIDTNVQRSVDGITLRQGDALLTFKMGIALVSSMLPMGHGLPPPSSTAHTHCMSSAPPLMADTSTGRRSTKRHKSTPTATVPPRSPHREVGEGTAPYDISSIGGDSYDMQRVSSACPTWDDETVHYVLEHGGRPPLVGVTGETRMELFCTFVAPNGHMVKNVRVPRAIIVALYGRVA